MSNMLDVNQVIAATGKKVSSTKEFKPAGTFQAINEARKELTSQGYTVGSMCRDSPIAAAKNYEYIAKWTNIPRTDWKHIEALIISPDFREGGCSIVYLS